MSSPTAAEIYDQFLVPAVFEPWARDLLETAELMPGERVLDVGCGSGIVSRMAARLAGPSGKVTGVDLNPAMLAVAKQIPPLEGSASIDWIEGPAEALPVPNAAFDLVTMQQVLQFVPDQPSALREARRALVPGGRLALAVWQGAEMHPAHNAIDAVLERHLGQPPLLAGFALSDSGEIRSLLTGAGFAIESFELRSKTSHYGPIERFAWSFITSVTAGIVSFRQLDVAAREELLTRIVPEVTEAMREYTIDGVVAFSWNAQIVIATTG